MTATAKSSVGVRMYLSDGSDPSTVYPTAISKSKPTKVTAAAPANVTQNITLLDIIQGVSTAFGVSSGDFSKLTVGTQVTLSGFQGSAVPLNGVQAITALDPALSQFSIAADSSTMTPEPSLSGVTATIPRTIALGGAVALVQDTNFPELDGKYFSVGNVTASDFDLIGSDTSQSTAVMGTNPKVMIWDGGIMVSLCLSAFAFNAETPGTVSVGTYCDPTASLPAAAVAAGTATLTGYIDVDDPAYPEILEAVEKADLRVFSIVLPQDQGEIIAPLTFSGITWDIPMGDGGMAFTATAALGSRPVHRF